MDGFSELVLNWRSTMMLMVVAPLILCGVILLFRRTESRAARPLGLFLILGGLSMGPQIIGFAGAYQIWPWLTFCPLFFTDLWMGPLLILHAHKLMRNRPLSWKKWLLLPGIIQTLYYTGAFLLPGDGLFDTPAKWAFNDAVHLPIIIPIESGLGIGLLILALILIWKDRRLYLKFLDQTQSAARDYDPIWLRNLVIALALGASVYAALEILFITLRLSYPAAFPGQVLLTSILTWVGLDAAWRLTAAFPKMAENDANTSAPEAPTPELSSPTDLAAQIKRLIVTDQGFLEPRLSIRDVAKRLGTNETYVSRALNAEIGESFNSFVNRARIDHAKILLERADLSVLSIAMESGFNSKATFNRVFRDHVGQTPTQYRREVAIDARAPASQNP